MTNTEINNSTLRLATGYANGNALSLLKTVDSNIEAVEIRLRGEDLGSSTVDVTVDNEESFDTNIGFNDGNEFLVTSTATNKKRLKFRINLVEDTDNSDPRVYSALCLYRYSQS